jgi:CRP-like cAMP-binding protein
MSERLIPFSAGSVIFRQGYPGEHAYIIQSGTVEIYKELPNGDEEQLALLQTGEMFGELALLDDAPRSASARAHTDCVLQIMEI